jgi:hypothetical protein
MLYIFHSKLSEFLFSNACIKLSPFYKKKTVRLPSGSDSHGCEFSLWICQHKVCFFLSFLMFFKFFYGDNNYRNEKDDC